MTATDAEDPRQAGFTLVEMLVVLAVVAVAVGYGASLYAGGRGERLMAATLASLANDLARTREDAIRAGRVRRLVFDATARTWRREGAGPVTLPEGMRLEVVSARQAAAGGAAAIAFLPDGRSSGGRIELQRDGERRTLTVNWLTGVAREAPR